LEAINSLQEDEAAKELVKAVQQAEALLQTLLPRALEAKAKKEADIKAREKQEEEARQQQQLQQPPPAAAAPAAQPLQPPQLAGGSAQVGSMAAGTAHVQTFPTVINPHLQANLKKESEEEDMQVEPLDPAAQAEGANGNKRKSAIEEEEAFKKARALAVEEATRDAELLRNKGLDAGSPSLG